MLSHLALIFFQLVKSRLEMTESGRKNETRYRDRRFRIDILSHYVVVWMSVLTSPRSFQLDFWLLVIALMDLAPLVYAVYRASVLLYTRLLIFWTNNWSVISIVRSFLGSVLLYLFIHYYSI